MPTTPWLVGNQHVPGFGKGPFGRGCVLLPSHTAAGSLLLPHGGAHQRSAPRYFCAGRADLKHTKGQQH